MAGESDSCLPLRIYLIRQIDKRVRSEINSLHVSDGNAVHYML